MPRDLRTVSNERGVALLIVVVLSLMIAAIGAVAVVASRTEIQIAAGFRQAAETLYAAEGALAVAVEALGREADWNAVLTGAATAAFTDGMAVGARTLPGGETVTLCCGDSSLSGEVQQRAFGGRSWAADTPQWQMYAWGPTAGWLPAGRIASAVYVAVWVADDPEDGDGNPHADTNGTLILHAEALGPGGGRRIVEAAVRRPSAGEDREAPQGLRVLSWQEIRW